MKVTALVVWPTTVEVEIPDKELAVLSKDNQEGLIREKLLNAAGDMLNTTTIRPVIQECSIPTLEE